MTNVIYYNNNFHPVNGNPVVGYDFYNYLQSEWKSGAHLTYAGNGTGTGAPYNYVYDGLLDGTPWSEISEDNAPHDERLITGSGPFDFNAGAKFNYAFAIVYTRDNAPAYNIVNLYYRNLADVRKIKQWYAADNFPVCAQPLPTGITPVQQPEPSLLVYPNPASNAITINYQPASAGTAALEIYNVQGQLIKHEIISSKVSIDVSGFTSGLYIVKISDGKNSSVQRFVKQ